MIIHEIEQGTPDWHLLRSGMPTASAASKIITSTGAESKSIDKYAETLAGDSFAGQPIDAWEGNIYTDRGHEIEGEARSYYEFKNDCEVDLIGFVTDDKKTFGASPDGRVSNTKLLEIKCLPKAHIENLRYYAKYKKCPPKFYPQVQFQLLACEAEATDLLFYHSLLPKLVITINRNDEFISKLKNQIRTCIIIRDKILTILKEF